MRQSPFYNQLHQGKRVLRQINRHRRFLLACSVGGCLMGLILNGLVIPPQYTSQAKLMIKGARQPDYVAPFDKDSEVRSLTSTGNPVLTQIEVLNSERLAKQVLLSLSNSMPKKDYDHYLHTFPAYFEPETLQEKVKLQTPASTDVITVGISTPDKTLSMMLVNLYISNYQEFLQRINRESLQQRGQYIRQQIRNTEEQLDSIRKELEKYRQVNQTIDLGGETQVAIQQSAELERQRMSLDSQISSHLGMANAFRRKLGMSTDRGIQSVALGMNTSLSELQKALNEAQQEYESLSVKYTDENPTIVALKSRMQEIQEQIFAETQRTIGYSGRGRQGGTSQIRRIADPVRSNMVDSLVRTESELQGLQSERQILLQNMAALKESARSFPEKQRRLATLLHSEKVLADMVDMLKLKAAEATIRASDDLSNVVVIDAANVPVRADFPRPIHIMLLMGLVGFFSGLGWMFTKSWRMMVQMPSPPTEERPPYPRKQYGQPTMTIS